MDSAELSEAIAFYRSMNRERAEENERRESRMRIEQALRDRQREARTDMVMGQSLEQTG